MTNATVAGTTSTASKRPDALFGEGDERPALRVARSAGASVWDENGKEYLDLVMALGAVALGYADPAVNLAAKDAVDRGSVGPLPPVEEAALAAELGDIMPGVEEVRFFKTGAEAVAAAVRLARTRTSRDAVLGCGYHGWLDWCSKGAGVPAATSLHYEELPFNDVERSTARIRAVGDRLACVVIEPVVDGSPDPEWLGALRDETRYHGSVLIYDEIKTALRVGLGGASARWGGDPDLVVLGKAIANGFPLAAVGGRTEVMRRVEETWISSTLATEFVSLAAARATLRVARERNLPAHLEHTGNRLMQGLERLAAAFPGGIRSARGIPQMCYLQWINDDVSGRVARECARRGLLFKRSAYNFVSLAHRDEDIDVALGILEEVLRELPC